MLVVQERDQFNIAKLTYTRGKDLSGSLEGAGGIGGLLALSDHKSQILDHAYYRSDGNGNVTCLADTNQLVVARYLYDPFGNTISSAGSRADVNRHRFSSKEWHASSGMPGLQRWFSRDPLGEAGFETSRKQNRTVSGAGSNLYQFVHNNPTIRFDSFGLWSWPPSMPYCPPGPTCRRDPVCVAGCYSQYEERQEQIEDGYYVCMAAAAIACVDVPPAQQALCLLEGADVCGVLAVAAQVAAAELVACIAGCPCIMSPL